VGTIHKLKDCARIAQASLAVDRVAILIGEVAGLAIGDGAKFVSNAVRLQLNADIALPLGKGTVARQVGIV
jgi:hypothetical protein